MAVFSQFGQAQNVKQNGKGTTADELVYTLNGTITGGTNGYAEESTITQNSITWKVTGNTTVNPWRIGGKNISNTNRPLYSTTTITDNISKIVVTHGTASNITVNSMTLTVSANSNFSNPTSTITGTFTANGTTTFNRPSGVDWSGKYFKITYNVSVSGNTNRYLQFNKAEFYKETSATPTITASDANITYDATSGSIPVAISNSVTGGTLSATSSESWLTIGTVTTTSVPFTCSANPNNTQRSATVTITYTYSAKASVTQTVTVTQAGNPGAGCDNYEGFENCTAHTSTSVSGTSSGSTPTAYLPTDWKGYGASYYPFTANFNSYMGSLDGNFLFFKASTSNACFLALPYENVTEMTFDYAYETDAYNNQLHLEIGYMTDISSSTWYSNTFHSIKELTNNGATWDSETVDFSSVSNTHYVVFKYSQSQGSWYSAAIDNVCVRAANSCPTPTDLNATNLTPNSATLSWTGEAESYNVRYRATSNGFSYNFESATPWTVDNFSPCTTYDGDGSGTGAIQDVDFENQNYTGSFIAFQNGITANAAAHGGNAFGACFYANPAPNNDYFILPAITIESGYVFKFWAKSFSSSYLESFRAGVYNGNGNLTAVLGSNTSVSNTWTEYSYNLSSYVGQTIQLAIHCNSNDCFAFFIDDIFVGDPNFNPTWSEPITGVTSPYILTGLDSDTEYEFQVQADCDTEGESAWSASATFTTLDGCAVPTDLNATNITASTATLSWTGFTDTYNIQYREYNPTAPATIILNVPSDIWGDGSGYQMLLDADATAIDNNSISDYSIFEYLIPTNATYDPNTSGFVINTSVTIQIPAGTYDWFITNPSPDYNNVYVAASNGNVGGRQNNYVFEAGKTYEFVPSLYGNNDGVDVTITDNGSAWIPVNGITSPYPLQNLNPQTTYQYQVQGVNCDGNGLLTDWSANAYFTTLDGFTVTATADPASSGTFAFTGSGVASSDANSANVNPNGDVTITATAAAGYTFMNWAEGGSVVSTSNAYTITAVDASHNLTAHFVDMTASNTWPATVTTLAAATPGYSENGDNITISNANGLAWLISTVNGLNGQSTAFSGKTITLTADVDMSAHIWVPIGTVERPFTCTFEGNGHVITGVTRSTEFPHNGLFGFVSGTANIQNVVVKAELTGNSITTGAVAGTFASTGTISNVEGAGTLTGGALTTSMGGLVGNNMGGTIHSSFAVNTMTASVNTTMMGGLIGTNGGNLKNSYANTTMSGSSNMGGLVGENGTSCLVENCYAVIGSQTFPSFAYLNSGIITYCYADKAGNYVTSGQTEPTKSGNYSAVTGNKEIGYMYSDNIVTATGNSYVTSGVVYDPNGNYIQKWNGLLSVLNQWVNDNPTYTNWFRPTTQNINGDLPVLGFPKSISMATENSDKKFLDYSDNLDHLLEDYGAKTASIFLYDNAVDVENVPGANLVVYINEDVVLKQDASAGTFINAAVGVTFDNSCGTATDFFGNTLAYDWHTFSTPLADAPLGISYNDDAVNYWEGNESNQVIAVSNSYMPDGLSNVNNWDFYCFYEPEYHWINLKRNSTSHYHYDAPHAIINYQNQTNLVPGKGYMAAINTDSYLCNTGTLNGPANPVSITLTKQSHEPGTDELGYNLIGNPYQAYLDVNEFLSTNSLNSYWVYIAESDNYVAGNASASDNPVLPSSTLHPHQGFFVLANNDNQTVNFDYSTMALETPAANSYFRGNKINYPLVNLFATSEKGKKDLTVIEFNRPEFGGSYKMHAINNADFELSSYMNDSRYSILFTEEGTEKVSVNFKTNEEGTFTMTWATYHGHFTSLFLVDNITGARIDMLRSDHYTFNASPDDYASRFYITFQCTNVDEYSENGHEDFAWFNGNEWVINGNGTLQVIDMLGRVLMTRHVETSYHGVSTANLATGVYMLRLINENKTKVQKIIVK